MVGRIEQDERGWLIIHEEHSGPYTWVTPFRISDDQELPDWEQGDIVEFSFNGYPDICITLTDKSYTTLKLDIYNDTKTI